MAKFPVLDRFRTNVLTAICKGGTIFFGSSYRIIKIATPKAIQYLESDKPALLAVYHGRMVGLLDALYERRRMTILISKSRDGEMIARIVMALGFSVARGSPGRGAIEGTRQLLRAGREGKYLAVTVDGPRGPIYEVKSGIIRLAQISGMPILPFVCRAKCTFWMWGWDKFMAPLWATPMIYVYGDPIEVPQELTEEEAEKLRLLLQSRMESLRLQADSYFERRVRLSAAAVPLPR